MRPWVIRWKDREWKSEDQPARIHIAVAHEYGHDNQWLASSPWNGPVALAAWLTVLFVTEAEVEDTATARLMVHSMPGEEFYETLHEVGDEAVSG